MAARCGAQTLSLLSSPRICIILRRLSEEPQRQVDLRRAAGSPAQTTMRSHLRTLEQIGAVSKHRRNAFPGSHEYELEPAGRELLFVMASLDRWLARAPEEPLELGTDAARAAVKAMVEGWSSTILRALAARPLSLTELDLVIGALSYPSLERRLGAMRLAGQVEVVSGSGKGAPYVATDWLRSGVGPLGAAARWEQRNLPTETAPVGRLDAEAGFLLMMPLVQLPETLSGVCRLAVELEEDRGAQPAGATVTIEHGRAVSTSTRLEGSPDGWARGSVSAWFRAAIEAEPGELEIGGDRRLAGAVLDSFYGALFDPRTNRALDRY